MRMTAGLRIALAALVLSPPALAQTDVCDSGAFALRADYPGARLSACEIVSAGEIEIAIHPEDSGRINPSPWYGFHVRRHPNAPAGELELRLRYGEHKHRYAPKVSADGNTWRRLPDDAVRLDGNDAVLRLEPDARGFFVSAGENLNTAFYAAWRERISAMAGAQWEQIGTSIGGRPIHALSINPNAKRYVLLLGRQHPPEVSGAIALLHFVERLLETRADACQEATPRCDFFRAHGLVVAPLLNPDGVDAGHWRHNLGGTDLNRDWGRFREPETLAVYNVVERFEQDRRAPRIVLDFHSTRRNVFYTQDADSPTRPAGFAERWLAAVKSRPDLYQFENAPRPLTEKGTVKNYFHRRFGIPSITYEVADEEDRALVASTAAALADALVDVFAAIDAAPSPPCADLFCTMAQANAASLVMLAEEGLLDREQAARIAEAAAWIVEEQARPGAARSANYLDFEERLIELAGIEASNVHMGRSRQDLHGTARRMLARNEWLATLNALLQARAAILTLAEAEAETPVPAYTHGVQAQPTTFGHQMLAFSAALRRDAERLIEGYARVNKSPLGAAALGTSGFALNRHRLAALLGFDAPIENSFDANLVASADYKLELAGVLTVSATTVGQFAQNIHAQYHDPQPWIVLDPATTSGSSIMPQKRNPRPLDRLRRSAGKVVASAHALVLLAHNANTGMHDYRELAPLLELAEQAQEMYQRYAGVVGSLHVDAERAATELAQGDSTLTEVADTLLREANVPFRSAHRYASSLADFSRSQDRSTATLTDADFRRLYADLFTEPLPLPPNTLRRALDPATLIANRRGFGGPQPAEVQRSLAEHRASLGEHQRWLRQVGGALAEAREGLERALDELF